MLLGVASFASTSIKSATTDIFGFVQKQVKDAKNITENSLKSLSFGLLDEKKKRQVALYKLGEI